MIESTARNNFRPAQPAPVVPVAPRRRNGRAPTPAPVFAITSGKGGVGKTNVVANLATTLARKKRRVLVIDADLGLAASRLEKYS
jgi:flagellar biosynthesis protein FlhG